MNTFLIAFSTVLGSLAAVLIVRGAMHVKQQRADKRRQQIVADILEHPGDYDQHRFI